jgi:hypothetical protein
VVGAAVPPTVTITNPPDGAVLSAPASLVLKATAASSAGSVTNVQFFEGSTLLGSVPTTPNSIPVIGLAAAQSVIRRTRACRPSSSTGQNGAKVTCFSGELYEPVIALTSNGEWLVLAGVAGLLALQGEKQGSGERLVARAPLDWIIIMKDSHSRGRPFPGLLFGVVGWTLGCLPLTAATVTVGIYNYYFSPSTVTINVNDSVEWIWYSDYHNSTSTTGLWGTGLYNTGYTYTYMFSSAGSFPYSCTYHTFTGTVMVQAVNVPPTVIITNPPNGRVLSAPASLTLGATATDADGSVTNVQFFQGSTSLGNVASAPYSKAVTGLAAGSYTFSAVASDHEFGQCERDQPLAAHCECAATCLRKRLCVQLRGRRGLTVCRPALSRPQELGWRQYQHRGHQPGVVPG